MAKNTQGHGRDAKIKECLCGHALIPYANGLCKKCYQSKWMNAWYDRTRHLRKHDHWRARNLKAVFKLSVAEYDEMLRKQGGVCKICVRPPKNKRLAVDHNHVTGNIRALLCGPCNTALSHVEHQSKFSKKALAYLEAN
jgi:hypothetical protein